MLSRFPQVNLPPAGFGVGWQRRCKTRVSPRELRHQDTVSFRLVLSVKTRRAPSRYFYRREGQ